MNDEEEVDHSGKKEIYLFIEECHREKKMKGFKLPLRTNKSSSSSS